MSKAKRHNAPWTAADVKRLRKLAKKKAQDGRRLSARAAARELGRTPGAVKYKAMIEGVSFRAVNQPAGVQKRLARRLRRARRSS